MEKQPITKYIPDKEQQVLVPEKFTDEQLISDLIMLNDVGISFGESKPQIDSV